MAVFRPEDEARVRELFAELERPVELLVALGPEETPLAGAARDVDFGAETVKIARGLAELSELVTARVEEEPAGFERYPAVSVRPEGREAGVRYFGLPFGYELGSLIGAVLEAGRTASSLGDESLARLAELDRDVTVDVFVTPT
jgi:alkyl hydroperoxide reductase subunit AhpF